MVWNWNTQPAWPNACRFETQSLAKLTVTVWTPNSMKARDRVFSLVAGSPCPWAVYMNSLLQPLGEVKWSQYLPTKQVLNFTRNLHNRRQIQPILSYHFFPCKNLQDISKMEWLMYSYSARKLNQDEYLESKRTELTFSVLNLLMARLLSCSWYYLTIHLWSDLTGLLTEPVAPRMASCWVSPERSEIYCQHLRTSEDGNCTISLGKLLPCLIGHMGKSFTFYSIENLLYSISLLPCPFQDFWTLFLQSSSHGIPSAHFLIEPKPGFLQPRICTQLFPLLTPLRIFKSAGSWALK